jgi:EpsG family
MVMNIDKSRSEPILPSTIAVLFIISSFVLVINLFVNSNRFADYFSYIELIDKYYYYRDDNWFFFEPASTLIFILLKHFFQSTELAADAAHYLLGIFYVALLIKIATEYRADWRSILLSFCVFGSLMAFVTIRATPAYLFVSIALLETLRGRYRALLYVFLGALFHMSAILALFPIILSLMQNKNTFFSWVYNAGIRSLLNIFALFAVVSVLQSYFQEFIYNFVNNVPILSRYLVYVYSSDANSVAVSVSAKGPSIFHFIYLVLCSLFVLMFISNKSDLCRKSRIYVFSSYIIFILMQFSPVTAFRQSVFWMLPAIFVFPWASYTAGKFGAYPLLIGAVGIFFYQLSTLFV